MLFEHHTIPVIPLIGFYARLSTNITNTTRSDPVMLATHPHVIPFARFTGKCLCTQCFSTSSRACFTSHIGFSMFVFQQNITIATGFYPASLATHTIRISMVTFRLILAIQCFRHTICAIHPYKIFMLVSQQMSQVLRFRHFTLITHFINVYMFTKYLLTEDRITPTFILDVFPLPISCSCLAC